MSSKIKKLRRQVRADMKSSNTPTLRRIDDSGTTSRANRRLYATALRDSDPQSVASLTNPVNVMRSIRIAKTYQRKCTIDLSCKLKEGHRNECQK